MVAAGAGQPGALPRSTCGDSGRHAPGDGARGWPGRLNSLPRGGLPATGRHLPGRGAARLSRGRPPCVGWWVSGPCGLSELGGSKTSTW